jgi:hypothetical protein
MPSTFWVDPKTWLEGEKLKADEVNEQVRDNLIWLFEKNYDIVQVTGVSDYQTTSTSAAVVAAALQLQLSKAVDETVLRFGMTLSAYNSSASAFITFDIRMDSNIYLSSGTTTPATNGLVRYQQDTASIGSQITMDAWVDNVDSGLHIFELVWWVSAGTGTINVTNTIAQVSVEEYGIGDVLLV